MCAQAARERSALYSDWFADFQRRLSQHDRGVRALAEDIADRTRWRVRARNTPGFEPPEPDAQSGPDILCVRGGDTPPLCLELELPETMVRKETLARLRGLVDDRGYDLRVVLLADAGEHEDCIPKAHRMLARAGIWTPVAALDADQETLTGADW
jgi:hypothetical protein